MVVSSLILKLVLRISITITISLLPFTPTTSESIGGSGKVPDLYDIFTCNFCHDRGDVDVNYLVSYIIGGLSTS